MRRRHKVWQYGVTHYITAPTMYDAPEAMTRSRLVVSRACRIPWEMITCVMGTTAERPRPMNVNVRCHRWERWCGERTIWLVSESRVHVKNFGLC